MFKRTDTVYRAKTQTLRRDNNEFLKECHQVEEQQATITQPTTRLDEQASQIQKVSAQLEASKPAVQIVNNNR
jgi:cytochrome c-type biogenesis protein CcmH/NrfG